MDELLCYENQHLIDENDWHNIFAFITPKYVQPSRGKVIDQKPLVIACECCGRDFDTQEHNWNCPRCNTDNWNFIQYASQVSQRNACQRRKEKKAKQAA